MSRSFNDRKVKLGWLSWTLGLNGLAIATNRMTLLEPDGKPFIDSGPSEIGIAFMPLFKKRLIIKHIDIHNPEVFATQLAPGKWNFSDLLVEGPEIRYVQIDDGRLHLRNLISAEQVRTSKLSSPFNNTKWRAYDFQNVNIKLVFPKKNQRRPWPFYLSFKLPGHTEKGKYTSTFSLTFMGNGTLNQWQKRHCSVDIRCEKMNPADWSPLISMPPGVNGLFDFKFKGQGIISEVIDGQLEGAVSDLSWLNAGKKFLLVPQLTWTSQLQVHHDYLSWNNLIVELAGLHFTSGGRINNWSQPNPDYAATIKADLLKLADRSFWRFIPGFENDKLKRTSSLANKASELEISLQKDAQHQKIHTAIKANGIPLGQKQAGRSNNGQTSAFLGLLEIEPQAPLNGLIEVDTDQRILLKDIQLAAGKSILHINGFIDAQKQQQEISLKADNLPLHKLSPADLGAIASAQKHDSVTPPPMMLSGKIDLDGLIKQNGNAQTVQLKAQLKQAELCLGDAVLASNLQGQITSEGKNVYFNKITGTLIDPGQNTGGNFNINGSLALENEQCLLDTNGHHLSLDQLSLLAGAAGIPLPEDVSRSIHGTIRELNLKLSGTAEHPNMTLQMVPEELYYQLAPAADGLTSKPLKITSGLVVGSGTRYELKEMAAAAQSGKIVLSGTFEGLQSTPKTIHLKINAMELSDLQNYLQSRSLPDELYKKLSAGLAPLQLAKVQGKINSDITITPAGQTYNLEGTITLANLNGQMGARSGKFEHLSGTIAVSSSTLTLQDLVANVAGSRLTLAGEIKNYQQTPSWNLQIDGGIRPQDLLPLLPIAVDSKSSLTSAGQLTSHSTISGDATGAKIVFTALAEPADSLDLKSDFGVVSQPDGKSLTIEGTLLVSLGAHSVIQGQNCRLTIDDSVIQANGKYSWSNENATAANKEESLDIVINTPNPVPTQVLVSALWPGIDVSGASGTIKATLAMSSESGNMFKHGNATLTHVALPSMNIKDLNGQLHTPRWSVSQNGQNNAEAARSEAKIDLSSAILSGLPAHDVIANIVLENGVEPRISISKGTATIAGGAATIDGFYLPQSGKWHLDLGLSKLYVDQFMSDLIEHSGEVTGLADGKISLSGLGLDRRSLIDNTIGHGEISIYKGTVPRLGQLQEKLTQANLLQQGIFGFNINNVFQTVLPVKAGKFKEANLVFEQANGIVNLEHMNFDGNNLRLRAVGRWNIRTNTIDIDVAGNIPRVASSILPGAVGEVSRHFTIQKAVRVVTFNKLENLPAVPILGDIGKDDPRAFTFKVAALLDQPNSISQSIGKSFKWLPNKPNASAHPIPGQAM